MFGHLRGIIPGLLAFAVLAATSASAQTSYVHAGRLVDTIEGKVLEDQLITLDGERVVAVEPFTPPPAGSQVLDWSAYTVLPGLIDAHTHLSDWGQSNNVAEPLLHSAEEIALIGALNARETLEAGFTSVRDVGAFRANGEVALRNAINRGWVPGPRMWVAGAYLTVPGGGGEVTGLSPDAVIPADMRVGVVRNAGEMREKSRYLFQQGVDFLKLIATGAVLAEGTEPGALELTEEEMRAAVEVADSFGSYATAHAHGAEGIKAAIRAGVRSIEHASLIDDEGIRMARDAGVWLSMDIYNGDFIEEVGTRDGWPADMLRKNEETTDAQREGFTRAVAAGVRIAYGTDAGVYPHGDNARQFAYMVRYGMTPMQAIQAATISVAQMMDEDANIGAIAPGRFADMIAVASDPLSDITALENVDHVMKGGELVR
ncbi:amidohydrolase family protein [Alteraurantiacibacter aestuarii]|uniref:Amidohydrolase family protein n=1 Tax=Alteraurantiacibacter aestuarii TaxID=650004 RepID=A0A844ZLX1_9SPHN|nr:amidohydrolase family protein [Alteraurantiacibacter aestuarii]MXO88106.1 amidohydrolase family protein [Alteraurantiacibacter aestuarii]